MVLPETIEIGGVRYIREDMANRSSSEPSVERWFKVSELVELTGFSQASIYRAMESGRLRYKCPNGSDVGRRVAYSEWQRYVASL